MTTLLLDCGCLVFDDDTDVLERTLEAADASQPLRIGRSCFLHGESEVIAAVDNVGGACIYPSGYR